MHTSGSLQPATGSGLHQDDWYFNTFLPKMRKYYKGPLVWSKGKVSDEANKAGRQWAIVNGSVYDLTDYFYTVSFLLRHSTPHAYTYLSFPRRCSITS